MKIILLPGLDGTGKLFEPFLADMPVHWSSLVISYPCDTPMDYAEYVSYAKKQLPSDEDYFLLGESFSGPIAIQLAALQISNLRGLVLCNTFARRPWWPVFGFLPWRMIFGRKIPKIIMTRMGAPESKMWLRNLLRSAMASVDPDVLAFRLHEVLKTDVTESLLSVNVPILYLRGSQDTTVREWSLNYIKSVRPDLMVCEHPVQHLFLQLLPQSAWKAIDSFRAKRKDS